MKLQRVAILLLALGLVVALEVVLMNTFTGGGGSAEVTPTPSTVPSGESTPVPTAPLAVPSVMPTLPGFTSPPLGGGGNNSGGGNNNNNNNTNNNNNNNNNNNSTRTNPPNPTQRPNPTAAPTNPPPPTDPPGTSVGSGSFSSNTGTGLNMSVSWEAREQGGGTSRVYINGTVNSYTLYVMSQPVSISFGGYSTSVMGKALNVTDSASQTSTSLFSTYIDVPSGTSGSMTVSWRYNGTYSDVQIDNIVASGNVYA